MNVDRFIADGQDRWTELRRLLASAKGRPERLGPAGVRTLGRLYREAAADLALARARFPLDPVTPALEALVGEARVAVYGAVGRRQSVVEFARRGYWRRVRERPVLLLLAAVLTFGPVAVTAAWAVRDPGHAGALVPGAYQSVTQPRPHGARLGLPAGARSEVATQIFTHNIRIAFMAFAGGITIGIVTVILLLTNGIMLGVIGGLAFQSGNGSVFTQLVIGHGVLELSCIVVAGASGLRLAMAIIDPGRRKRADVIAESARAAVEIALGTAVWLVVAGLVEGLITPVGIGLVPISLLGVGLGAVYWTLVAVLGRATVTTVPDVSGGGRP
ncbi:MAG: hypothetical protein QOG64_2876 [Acidimicrobiaceae bacterium]|nr:hypothetical protein [Acidimicrobiaceae bacterium]